VVWHSVVVWQHVALEVLQIKACGGQLAGCCKTTGKGEGLNAVITVL
jgi:hypothetical protein